MLNDFLESIGELASGAFEKDGAREARSNLEQTWNYPSLVAALPYRYHDDANELYINQGTIGFILEAAPLQGANEQIVASLDDMLRKKLPRNTPLSVIMAASKCVGERLANGLSPNMWKGKMAAHLNKITQAYWATSALDGIKNKRGYPLYLRNYRVFIVYAKSPRKVTPRVLDEIKQLRSSIKVSLESARIQTINTSINSFNSIMRELTNYRSTQVMPSDDSYNQLEEINRQVVDQDIDLKVRPNHIRVELPPLWKPERQQKSRKESQHDLSATSQEELSPLSEQVGLNKESKVKTTSSRIVNLQMIKPPKKFALWQGADNLQNLRFPDLGISCPFVITWCVELEEQTKSQNESFRKDMDFQKKANSAYAMLVPGVKKAAQEWQRLREGLSSGDESMCRFYFNLTLFTPDTDEGALACELAAINVFRKNNLELSVIRFQQMRNWLSSMPFMLQEGLWEDLKKMGATLRATSFNAVNLMPMVAERHLSGLGMPLPTYRNQLTFFDMFSEDMGGTNFNIAVTGTSGAGKTFLLQGVLREVLNSGGYAWVIDMGDGYKNYCLQEGGVYLDGSKLRFNPFANVNIIEVSAAGIVSLLAVLASPKGDLDEVSEAILKKAVVDAWNKKKNQARIDDVYDYLTNKDVLDAYEGKPTIIARLAELALLLETYCTWGTDGVYFNSDDPTLKDDTRFAVLELLSLQDNPKLLSAILFSLILAVQEKMYHTPRDLKKLCLIDEAWRLLSGSNPHAARFIETGYRTVRRHRGAFITITQGIKDFSASKEAEAAWNNSATKITLLQDTKAFKEYLAENPNQFTPMEQEVIRYFQKAEDTWFSSLLISSGEQSSFHRMFVDPVTRAMFSSRGVDFEFMQNAQKAGATSEEAAYMLAQDKFGPELSELEAWVEAA